jgi:hypothetical protein
MMIANRRLCIFGALFLSLTAFSIAASAQTTAAETPLDKFAAHFDLGVSATGEITSNTSGPNYLNQQLALAPSTTVGALVELRYTRSPRVGIALNYGFARYTDNYTFTNGNNTPSGTFQGALGIQTQAAEYTLGYVGHFGEFLGIIHPFIGLGGGVMAFRPTPGGGSGLHVGESRGLAYYAVGAEAPLLGDNFGLRVQFRQQFFGAPDFNQNYLANGARSSTIQPTVGFYLKF